MQEIFGKILSKFNIKKTNYEEEKKSDSDIPVEVLESWILEVENGLEILDNGLICVKKLGPAKICNDFLKINTVSQQTLILNDPLFEDSGDLNEFESKGEMEIDNHCSDYKKGSPKTIKTSTKPRKQQLTTETYSIIFLIYLCSYNYSKFVKLFQLVFIFCRNQNLFRLLLYELLKYFYRLSI